MKRAHTWWLAGLVIALVVPASWGTEPETPRVLANVTLDLRLVPKAVVGNRGADLWVIVESSAELRGASLEIRLPQGFRAENTQFALPSFTRTLIRSVAVHAAEGNLLSGERVLVAEVSSSEAGGVRRVLASKTTAFEYDPEISLWTYLFVSLLGVVCGYGLRLFIRVLGSVEPPQPEPASSTSGGKITQFVKSHYYLVDLLVSLGLASVLLISLIQGGRPPQAGATWYGAFAAAVAIGLFTNSELLTKIKR